jgi:hypothetical protein
MHLHARLLLKHLTLLTAGVIKVVVIRYKKRTMSIQLELQCMYIKLYMCTQWLTFQVATADLGLHSFFLAFVRRVWQDFDRDCLHKLHMCSYSTGDLFGMRDCTSVLIYANLTSESTPVLNLPLRLLLESSSLPKIASRASAVVSCLRLAIVVPGLSLITCSTGLSLGGVENGGTGILCEQLSLALPLAVPLVLPWPLASCSLKVK